ncbi:MAG: hypothetical protein ABEJ82_02760 [Haloplanus sp.]
MRPSNRRFEYVSTASDRVGSGLRRSASRLRDEFRSAAARTRTALGDVAARLRDPVTTLLLGRRRAVSVALVGLGVLAAFVTAWWVAATTGYPPLERWVAGTWSGRHPHGVVFAGVGLLLGVAALSAAANAGLFPTTTLVAGPLFGVALTRYGTVVADPIVGRHAVSAPDAVAFAGAVAFGAGIPLAVAGYFLGSAGRRAVRVVRTDPALARADGE